MTVRGHNFVTSRETRFDEQQPSAPQWVPDGAKVHVDFANDRAWTADDGAVAISTLLGAAENNYYGSPGSYDGGDLTADGLVNGPDMVSFIGRSLQYLTAGATVVVQNKSVVDNVSDNLDFNMFINSADGNYGMAFGMGASQCYIRPDFPTADDFKIQVNISESFEVGTIQRVAWTYAPSPSTGAMSISGADQDAVPVHTDSIDVEDWFPADHLPVAGGFTFTNNKRTAMQSLTIYGLVAPDDLPPLVEIT